jgi:hypothetical protein
VEEDSFGPARNANAGSAGAFFPQGRATENAPCLLAGLQPFDDFSLIAGIEWSPCGTVGTSNHMRAAMDATKSMERSEILMQ